jgi:hypothetical protein
LELAEPRVKDCTALDASAGLQNDDALVVVVVVASSGVATDVLVL